MTDVNGIAADRLRSFIERIERLEEEKKGIAEDIKEIYAEAKGTGFEPKIMRKIIALRKKSKEDRQEEQTLLALYGDALGMQLGLDLLEPAPAPEPARAAAAKVEEPAGDRVSEPAPAQTDLVDYLSKRVPPDRVGAGAAP